MIMIISTNILADYEGAKLRTTQAVEGTGGQRQQYKARLFTRYMRQSTACVDRGHQQAADSTTTAASSQPYESADAKSILAKPAILEPSHYSLLVAEASDGHISISISNQQQPAGGWGTPQFLCRRVVHFRLPKTQPP